MYDKTDTAAELLAAATRLFSRLGYDGTSVRAITAHAGANLGAITYHFGSKEVLYDAVLESVTRPIRELIEAVAEIEGPPLTRIEHVVRGFFQYLRENPEFPNLISQQLASSRPMPAPARDTLRRNLKVLSELIVEGQRDGSIRAGNARNLALSIASQPMWLTLARRALREGAGLDQADSETYQEIVESVVQFVRAGLQLQREGQP